MEKSPYTNIEQQKQELPAYLRQGWDKWEQVVQNYWWNYVHEDNQTWQQQIREKPEGSLDKFVFKEIKGGIDGVLHQVGKDIAGTEGQVERFFQSVDLSGEWAEKADKIKKIISRRLTPQFINRTNRRELWGFPQKPSEKLGYGQFGPLGLFKVDIDQIESTLTADELVFLSGASYEEKQDFINQHQELQELLQQAKDAGRSIAMYGLPEGMSGLIDNLQNFVDDFNRHKEINDQTKFPKMLYSDMLRYSDFGARINHRLVVPDAWREKISVGPNNFWQELAINGVSQDVTPVYHPEVKRVFEQRGVEYNEGKASLPVSYREFAGLYDNYQPVVSVVEQKTDIMHPEEMFFLFSTFNRRAFFESLITSFSRDSRQEIELTSLPNGKQITIRYNFDTNASVSDTPVDFKFTKQLLSELAPNWQHKEIVKNGVKEIIFTHK